MENVVRRAAILAQSEKRDLIRELDLPEEILKSDSIHKMQSVYKPIEIQILELLRSLKFSHSAISQTASALGNRDRGTITEYFKGICFEHLVKLKFNIEQAALTIAATTDKQVVERVKIKINEYLNNLRTFCSTSNIDEDINEKLSSPYKGLPKKYHPYLQQVFEHLKSTIS